MNISKDKRGREGGREHIFLALIRNPIYMKGRPWPLNRNALVGPRMSFFMEYIIHLNEFNIDWFRIINNPTLSLPH